MALFTAFHMYAQQWRKSAMPCIRTLVVDDDLISHRIVTALLARHPQIEIVGRAYSGREALEQVAQTAPDLVLMDWSMPEMSGLQATLQIKSSTQSPCIVMVTMNDSPEYRALAAAAGADGFISKMDVVTELCPLITTLFPEPDREEGVARVRRYPAVHHLAR
jgi:DNA-binding NarL/FixJ family response regulator